MVNQSDSDEWDSDDDSGEEEEEDSEEDSEDEDEDEESEEEDESGEESEEEEEESGEDESELEDSDLEPELSEMTFSNPFPSGDTLPVVDSAQALLSKRENPEADNFEDEEDPWANKEDEEEKNGHSREMLAGYFVCWCCCLLVILGIVLGVVLSGGGDDDNNAQKSTPETSPSVAPQSTPTMPSTPSMPSEPTGSRFTLSPAALSPPSSRPPPTAFPTISPIPTMAPVIIPTKMPTPFPTLNPTISPEPSMQVPDELELTPFADTTIFKDGIGELEFESFGTDDTMLVQDGLASKTQIPDAFFIFAFDMSDVPTFDRIQDRSNFAQLRLSHVPGDVARDAATLHLVRLPSTPLVIETLFGSIFVPSGGIEGPAFQVDPLSAEDIVLDITDLVFGTPIQDDQLLLMVENRGPEQEAGDRFKSRESDSPPRLLLDFVREGEPLPTHPPTKSPAPTATPRPTSKPSISGAPSESPKPSFRPTDGPTLSPSRTFLPSSSPAPTTDEIEI